VCVYYKERDKISTLKGTISHVLLNVIK